MKAAVVEKPGVLTLREIPEPEMGDYDALCRLLFGATCTGTDQHLIAGRFPWPVSYPTILGHESVGRVVRVGPKVRHFKPGELITRVGTLPPPGSGLNAHWGGFTQWGIARDHRAMKEDGLPPQEWRRYRVNQVVPAGIDPRGATMLITWRETFSYLTRMGVREGCSLLVIGSGGNGLAFVAHARNLGAQTIAVVGNVEREAVGRTAGATHYFDYKGNDLAKAVPEASPGGFQFLIDAVGKSGQIDLAIPWLAPGGILGIYGIDEYHACSFNPFRSRGTFTFYNGGYDEEEAHERVVGYMQSGQLRADVWLDLEHPFPLEGISAAFDALRQRRLVKALVRLEEGDA
ncbi:MAG: zinc-binding dehydrogenase [Planctomycetes bacterium]|nr:zinc-binding dehydrogenase [Planctomycetota bacterium]